VIRRLLLLGTVVAIAATVPCKAGEGLEAEPMVGGFALHCRDFRGVVVRTVSTTELGDVARAWIVRTTPIIALDPDRLATLPGKMQVFFYGHECAHHVLAHNFYPTPSSENDADCWSIQHGRDSGLFTREDVEGFAPYLASSKGSPFGHLPGPEREAHLLQCFDDRSTTAASSDGFFAGFAQSR
jgi:hypothetical protein